MFSLSTAVREKVVVEGRASRRAPMLPPPLETLRLEIAIGYGPLIDGVCRHIEREIGAHLNRNIPE
jgi:hypothetical protein